jgi:dimethylargininase
MFAFTRDISAALAHCELTHLPRVPIDVALARRQHEAYERALSEAGCAVHRLDAGDDMPDSVFIEDTAVIFDELAIVARPGAASRRAETSAVSDLLAPHRAVHRIVAPGTLDGGDVLVVSRRVFVGASGRTNAAGIEQLRHLLAPHGYTVEAIDVHGCLHLKSAVTALDDRRVLLNPAWIDAARFEAYDRIEVDPLEPFAANALPVGDRVIYPGEFTRTAERLRERGVPLRLVAAGELAKAEGGVTCCSLIVRMRPVEVP